MVKISLIPAAAAQEKISADLTAEGSEAREIDSEAGKIEVHAVKGGRMYGIGLDTDLKIARTREEG